MSKIFNGGLLFLDYIPKTPERLFQAFYRFYRFYRTDIFCIVWGRTSLKKGTEFFCRKFYWLYISVFIIFYFFAFFSLYLFRSLKIKNRLSDFRIRRINLVTKPFNLYSCGLFKIIRKNLCRVVFAFNFNHILPPVTF